MPERSILIDRVVWHTRLSWLCVKMTTTALSGAPTLDREASNHADDPLDLHLQDDKLETTARLTSNGRVSLKITDKQCLFAKHLLPLLRPASPVPGKEELPGWMIGEKGDAPPPLNIVIQIVGSRGDVQPFVALGKELKDRYGHRIRLATHATFKKFVEENGLEFFSIGGDPAQLMDYSKCVQDLTPDCLQ